MSYESNACTIQSFKDKPQAKLIEWIVSSNAAVMNTGKPKMVDILMIVNDLSDFCIEFETYW